MNIPDEDTGITALMAASFSGQFENVKLLLAHGANVNLQNCNGLSALIFASHNGQLEIVKLLLEHGAKMGSLP